MSVPIAVAGVRGDLNLARGGRRFPSDSWEFAEEARSNALALRGCRRRPA
jgi:hypothetical protein